MISCTKTSVYAWIQCNKGLVLEALAFQSPLVAHILFQLKTFPFSLKRLNSHRLFSKQPNIKQTPGWLRLSLNFSDLITCDFINIVSPVFIRYHKNGQSLLVLLPSEESEMIKALEAKKIPINKIRYCNATWYYNLLFRYVFSNYFFISLFLF